VVLHGEPRGFPSLDSVTRGALRAGRTLGELSIVWVGLVAVHALLESQRLFKVPVSVALDAINRRVLSEQGIFCFGVIEALVDRFRRDLLPPTGVVAGLAALGKASVMRIGVAIRTLREGNPRVTRLVVRSRGVAFLTSYLGVQTGEWIASFCVIELLNLDGFPVFKIVALQAVCSQPPLVFVLVAGDAARRNTQECPVQIFNLDGRALGGRNFVGGVALSAGQARVLAFQYVSRLLVIEGLGIPLHNREVLAVVLRVAAHALFAGAWGEVIRGVQTLPIDQASGDLGVAIQALEAGFPGPQPMARGAVRGAVQGLMGAGKGARRNLCRRRKGKKQERTCNDLQHQVTLAWYVRHERSDATLDGNAIDISFFAGAQVH